MDVQSSIRPSTPVYIVDEVSTLATTGPFVVASNRGPFTFTHNEFGVPVAQRSPGGLVTALLQLGEKIDFTWLATPVSAHDRKIASGGSPPVSPSPHVRVDFVSMAESTYTAAYDQIATRIFYYLQHNLWDLPHSPHLGPAAHRNWSSGFRKYAQAFSSAISRELRRAPLATVMLHDPHMYLVPRLVRDEYPSAVITHFTGIPWPDARTWMFLPRALRAEMLDGLLGADIVGFQTTRDASNFLDCVRAFVPDADVDADSRAICYRKGRTLVRHYPIAIDVDATRASAASEQCRRLAREIRPDANSPLIVRVDRLDPAKNIMRGFAAFELLLRRQRHLADSATFIAILPPSRAHLADYRRYARLVDRQVARINRRFRREVIRMFSEHDRERALAALSEADVVMVNSLVDGMNLVAKETVAVTRHHAGLVLSESVGAFEQLGSSAFAVAPTDVAGTAEALAQALGASHAERAERHRRMLYEIQERDLSWWWRTQLEDIETVQSSRSTHRP